MLYSNPSTSKIYKLKHLKPGFETLQLQIEEPSASERRAMKEQATNDPSLPHYLINWKENIQMQSI